MIKFTETLKYLQLYLSVNIKRRGVHQNKHSQRDNLANKKRKIKMNSWSPGSKKKKIKKTQKRGQKEREKGKDGWIEGRNERREGGRMEGR